MLTLFILMAALIYVAIFEPVTTDSQYNLKRYERLNP